MNKIYLTCFLGILFFGNATDANNNHLNRYAMMTAQDLKNNALSNISLINNAGQQITVAGLFIASYDTNDCSACYGGVTGGDNMGGTNVGPIIFQNQQALPIGQNYLYNMLYNGMYFVKNSAGSSPCSLPGCSWPGDNSDVHGWCITINAVGLGTTYTHSSYTNGSNPPASAPSYGSAGNSTPYNYRYDLVNPDTLGTGSACLGPIVCNDQTLTCKVATPQHETFSPY